MKKIVFALAISIGISNISTAEATPSVETISMVMGNMVERVVIPAYNKFHQTTEELQQSTASLCATPNQANLATARDAFTKTAIAWGGIEFLRSGPVMAENRLERVLFYPDRKSTGLKQVQRALAKQDVTVTSIDRLRKKSVAVQGLGALEFLLFGTKSETLIDGGNGFRCKFAETAAINLNTIAAKLVNAWQAEDGIQSEWKKPGGPKAIFRTKLEAVNELLGIAVHGIEAVRDIRLGAFLRKKPSSDRPKSALLWRSDSTIAAMTANVEMVVKMFDAGGMNKLVTDDEFGIINSIQFEFTQVLSALRAIDKPINVALKDEGQRKKLEYLKLTLGYLLARLDPEFSTAAGLASGFSFSDGD